MSRILLLHHLGLGDHFMCHGIVREYCKKYEKVGLFAWPRNYVSVSFMFRDLANLTIIEGDEESAREFIRRNETVSGPDKYDVVKIIGFENLRRSGTPLEKQFYEFAGVDFNKKWDSFYVQRDHTREQSLFEKIAPKGDYAFLHEDRSRGMTINRDKIRGDLQIIEPDPSQTDNVFDYCMLIERAKEIHVIDSSFMFLIDCLSYDAPNQKLYVHRYARENRKWKLPTLKKNWHIFLLENYTTGLITYIRRRLHVAKMYLLRIVD